METWLPFAIKHPGPIGKAGYDGGASRLLTEIEGEVKHSSEGTLAGALAVLADPNRTASWHLTIAKDGRVFQHYPLEAITWHCGLPGDRRFDTSLVGNLTLVGEEHEGGGPGNMGEPLTVKQLAASVRISQFVREVCPHVAANPPTLRKNLWNHGWLSPTSCPSGRIPWETIIAALLEPKEEDMTPEDRTWIGEQLASVVTQVRTRIDEQGGVRDKQAAAILAKIAAIQIGSGMTEAEFAALVARIELVVR